MASHTTLNDYRRAYFPVRTKREKEQSEENLRSQTRQRHSSKLRAAERRRIVEEIKSFNLK